MAVVDDFGRVTKLAEDMSLLLKSLKASVGKAVAHADVKSEKSNEDMKNEFQKLVKAMEELGGDIKDSLKSTEDFVSEVKKTAESIEKIKSSKADSGYEKLANAQKEQTRILGMILRSQQKATSEKVAKFTTGGSSLSSTPSSRPALKEMGFRAKGADKIPAMLSPNEFIVNRKGTEGNESLLNKINRGYFKGGKVKPQYLASGTLGGESEALAKIKREYRIEDIEGVATIIIEGKHDQELLDKIKNDYAKLGKDVSVKFSNELDKELKRTMARWATGIATAFTGGGDAFQTLFEGSIKDITEFRREMRRLAFQTEGITGQFREAQAEFAKIGDNIVPSTGKSITAFYKVYLANAKKGFKDQKAGMNVLKSGLKLSTLIGSETEATASLFGDWHRELGLGTVQIEKMANNMKMVAKNTGVTGDELIGVMKSSESILKNLRNQGSLTTTAAKNITRAMADFKKQGFGEEGQKILSAMSGYAGFQGADEGTRSVLSIASNVGGVNFTELMFGDVLQDGEKMGKMADGLKEWMSGIINIDPNNFDIQMLTKDQKESLALNLQGMGMSLAEADAAIKVFAKGAQGLGGELSEFEKIRKSATATEAERQLAEKNMNESMLHATMDMMGNITQVAEKFPELNLDGITKELGRDTDFGREFESGTKNLAAMAPYLSKSLKGQFGLKGTSEQMGEQIKSMDIGKQIELSLLSAGEQLDRVMKKEGKKNQNFQTKMQKALASGDKSIIEKLSKEMATFQSEMQVSDATGVDPIDRLEQTMQELNATIRSSMSPIFGAIMDFIGSAGLMAIQVGLMATAIYGLVGKNILGGLKGIGGIGLGMRFEKFAESMAVRDGMFKNFFQTYVKSRKNSPARMGPYGPMGKGVGGKGVLGSLRSAFGTLADDLLGGFAKARTGVFEFFKSFRKGFMGSDKLFARGGRDLFARLFDGFSGAMKSNNITSKLFDGITKGFSTAGGRVSKIVGKWPLLNQFLQDSLKLTRSFASFKGFGGIFSNFIRAMSSGFNLFKSIIGKGISVVRNAFSPRSWMNAFGAVRTAISGGFKGIRAATTASTLGMAQVIFSVIDMVFGAVSGFMNTGKRFEGVLTAMGKSTNDLTWGMYASSTIAGGLVGILDGLTFGLLRITGAAEFLESALSLVLYSIFSVAEGIVSGLMAPLQAVWSAVKYIGTQFQDIGDSILGVFNSIAGIFGAEAGNWSEAFAMIYPYLKNIGIAIGAIIGIPLAAGLWAIAKGISLALVPIQMLINAVAGVIKVIAGFVKFFQDIFSVGLWQATRNLGSTVWDAIAGVFEPVTKFLWSLMDDILAPFYWLGDVLCWNSIIPDMVVDIVKWFAMLPVKIFKLLVTIPYMIGKALSEVPAMIGGIFSSVGEYLGGFGTEGPFSFLITQLGAFYTFLGDTFKNLSGMISGVLDIIYGILTLDFGKIWEGLTSFGSSLLNQAKNFGSFLWKLLKNSISFFVKMVKKIPKMFIKGLKSVFYDFPRWLMGKLMDGIWAVGNFLIFSLPQILWNAFKNSLSAVGKFVWDTLSWPFVKLGEFLSSMFDFEAWGKSLSELGTFVYDGFKSALQKVWDWLVGLIPGAKTIGRAVEKTKEAAGYAWDKTKKVAGDAWQGLKAAGSYLNPFSYFEGYKEGTKKIDKPGLAMLHEGEMVVPKNVLNQIGAEGDKPFSIGGTLSKGIGSAMSTSPASCECFKGGIDSIVSLANSALGGIMDSFNTVKGYASSAFDKLGGYLPKSIKDYASSAFDKLGGYLPKSIKDYASSAFGHMGDMFSPLTKGFMRSMEQGNGILSSIGRGLKSQFASMTKGKSISEIAGSAFNTVRGYASSAFDKLGGYLPKSIKDYASSAFDKLGGYLPKSIKDYASSAFGHMGDMFSPLTKGFMRSMEQGNGILSSIGRGLKSQFASMTKGKSISEIAGSAFNTVKKLIPEGVRGAIENSMSGTKDLLKRSFQSFKDGSIKKFLKERAKGAYDSIKDKSSTAYKFTKDKASKSYESVKSKIFGEDPTDSIKKVGSAGDKISGGGKDFANKMKNIAKGIKEFSGVKVLAGAMNLIPSSVGLVALVPGSYGLKKVQDIDGEKVFSSFKGISKGLSKMANRNVFLGALALAAVGVSSLALVPAIPIFALLGSVGTLVQTGLVALGKGITAFGTSVTNPMTLVALAVLGAFNILMIPLAYAISLLTPAIEAIGKAIKSAFEGMGTILKSAFEGLSMIFKEITMSKALALGAAAIGIAALGAAMIAFAAGGVIASWISYFTGDGVFNKIMEFAAMSSELMVAANAVDILAKSMESFGANKGGSWTEWLLGSDGAIEAFKELSKVATPEFIIATEAIHKLGMGMEKIHSIPAAKPVPGDATTATTPVGEAITAADSSGVMNAQPIHLRDITGTILRERAGAEGNRLHSDELSRMEEASYRQVEELEQIKQGISELVELMKPKGSLAGEGGSLPPGYTKDPRRPRHSAMFGRMKFGSPGGGANRQVINTGEV